MEGGTREVGGLLGDTGKVGTREGVRWRKEEEMCTKHCGQDGK